MEFFLKLFPFMHFVVLLAGGILLLIVKRKYPKIRKSELMIVFILFFILVAIFTEPGLDLIKRFITLIQG